MLDVIRIGRNRRQKFVVSLLLAYDESRHSSLGMRVAKCFKLVEQRNGSQIRYSLISNTSFLVALLTQKLHHVPFSIQQRLVVINSHYDIPTVLLSQLPSHIDCLCCKHKNPSICLLFCELSVAEAPTSCTFHSSNSFSVGSAVQVKSNVPRVLVVVLHYIKQSRSFVTTKTATEVIYTAFNDIVANIENRIRRYECPKVFFFL